MLRSKSEELEKLDEIKANKGYIDEVIAVG